MPLCAISSEWVPCSATAPLWMTTILSAPWMVDRRWAITRLVRPIWAWSSASCTTCSHVTSISYYHHTFGFSLQNSMTTQEMMAYHSVMQHQWWPILFFGMKLPEAREAAQNQPFWRMLEKHSATHYDGACSYWYDNSGWTAEALPIYFGTTQCDH